MNTNDTTSADRNHPGLRHPPTARQRPQPPLRRRHARHHRHHPRLPPRHIRRYPLQRIILELRSPQQRTSGIEMGLAVLLHHHSSHANRPRRMARLHDPQGRYEESEALVAQQSVAETGYTKEEAGR